MAPAPLSRRTVIAGLAASLVLPSCGGHSDDPTEADRRGRHRASTTPPSSGGGSGHTGLQRETVEFTVDDDTVVAHVTRIAHHAGPQPMLVMAHGLGLLQSSGLQPYVDRFAREGIAVLTFDYRTFGESEGSPRQLIDPKMQLDDWRAAIAFAREQRWADPSRIAIWGSSFSGGHVLSLAAQDSDLAAVVSQVPYVDGAASVKAVDPRTVPELVRRATADERAAEAGKDPVTVPLVADPGAAALMSQPGSKEGYLALIGHDPNWRNATPARIVGRLPSYEPAAQVREALRTGATIAPVFVGIAKDDLVTPPDPARAVAKAIGAETHEYDGGHFDVYRGRLFEEVVADEVAFLRDRLHLPGGRTGASRNG